MEKLTQDIHENYSDNTEFDGFFCGWFRELSGGLDCMSEEECSRLFSCCAARCAADALKHLYREPFECCGGDLDLFFSSLHGIDGVDGTVIEQGRVYELIFEQCSCDLHTRAHIDSPRLCECSRQSIILELKALMPDEEFGVTEVSTVLGGGNKCRFRIERK